MVHNPFFIGQPVPPERFVGRKAEIETAFDQISSRSNLAVWGGSGIGKSSFLEQLASPQIWQLQKLDPSQAVIVLLSCLSIHPFSASGFWREVLRLIKDELDNAPALQTKIDEFLGKEVATKDDLRQVLRKLGKQNKFLVLLIDDFDAAFRSNEQYTEADIKTFMSECRNLAYHSQERKYLSMVVTSLRRLNELGPQLTPDGSPWYNHYLFQPLKPFTDTEVAMLLGCMPMTQALGDGIREIAGGHPALLQIAGSLLYQELRTEQVPNVETFAKGFESRARHFFQDTWALSNEIEQTLLMLIALFSLKGRLSKKRYDLGSIDIIFSQRERELTDLEERGVIIHTAKEGKTVYSFASSLMEWWVVKELENSNETWLQEREKVFLTLMSHKQKGQITTAIHWLWQHKEELPSILQWIGKVAAALPKGAISG